VVLLQPGGEGIRQHNSTPLSSGSTEYPILIP
jgi:hypothetical protein